MNGIPFAYWGAGNCTDFMPATASLEVYYNVNQPESYTIGSNTIYNIAPNFTQYTGSTTAQYDFAESALDLRSNSIFAYYPFNMYGGGISKTIMFRAKLDSASEQYFLFRNTLNLDEGARAFNSPHEGFGFQRGVYACNVLSASAVSGYNSEFVTIAIQTNGAGLGVYYIPDDNYTNGYAVNAAPINCTTINDYDIIMENAGFMQSWAVWDTSLTPSEMRSASIAFACNAVYDPYINPNSDTLITDGLVSYLGCDSFSGTTWTDKSGNGNNATMYGSSTNQVSGGVYFNGFAYDVTEMNYLQFPNPLAITPTANTTLIMQGVFDTQFQQYLFRKGWTQFGYLSGSLGWDTTINATSLNFSAAGNFNLDYTAGTSRIYVLSIASGSVDNVIFTKPKTYTFPDVASADWGATGNTNYNFTGSGTAQNTPLTFGNSNTTEYCNIYRFDSTSGNQRYYSYIDSASVQVDTFSGAGTDVDVVVYPNTVPIKTGDNQGNTLQSRISFIGTTNITASVTQSLLQSDVNNGVGKFPFKGQISNLLVYNKALSAPEIFSNYNYLINNTVCADGTIPSEPLPYNFPVSNLTLWNNVNSLSGSIWYDLSGNNNNGTVYGTPLTKSTYDGVGFNGINNFVAYSSGLNAQPLNSWSMQIYTTFENDGINRDLFSRGYWQNGFDSYANLTGGNFRFLSEGVIKTMGGFPTYSEGEKSLITITCNDITNVAKLYINGTPISVGSAGNISNFTTQTVTAGATNQFVFGYNAVPYSSSIFKGNVRDILLYSKDLSDTEVSQSYFFLDNLISEPYYNVTQCGTTSSFYVSLAGFIPDTPYETNSILDLSGSGIYGCYTVNSNTTASVTASYTDVRVGTIWPSGSCTACVNSHILPGSGSLVVWTSIDSLTGSVWYDNSGNSNNGLVSGSTLTLSGSLGYSFNGTDNYVTFPATLVGQPSSSYTIQYFGTMFDDGTNRDLWVKDDFNDGWDTIWEPSTDKFIFRDNNTGDIGLPYNYTPPNKVLVTLTLNDTTNKASLYINESLIVTGSGPVNAFNLSTLPLKFGFNTNGDATYFKGAISDLLVYNKDLNATAVSHSYAFLSGSRGL
jgi:hypothetical protein